MNEMTDAMDVRSNSSYEKIVLSLKEKDLNRIANDFPRLERLFNVDANIEPLVNENGPNDKSTSSPVFNIKLVAKSVEALGKAEKYLGSLVDPESCVTRFCPNTAAFQCIAECVDYIERNTCAALKLAENLTVEVKGCEEQVASALVLVDRNIKENACESSHLEKAGATRTKLESEDSSYDSDYENSDPRASPNLTGESHHYDVSRTVSDTLGAEFAEYVCLHGSVSEEAPEKDEERDDDDVVFSDPNYTNRIEFALKLGYTERQGYIALQKLGSKAEQNELLAELIKLGASSPSSDVKAGIAEAFPNNCALKRKDVTSNVVPLSGLRHVVIDGSNVAMSHGNKEVFSCHGIKLCVDWFKARGHREITVFVPSWRKEASRPDAITKDQDILWELEKERLLVFTPSRQMGGRRMACHDDRYILKLAAQTDGIVVSNDNYRDLLNESPEYKRVIEERLLMFSFVNDRFMPPDDPMGRHGPFLDSFLHKQMRPLDPLAPSCPYGKKCTYGNKCKYYHPERGNQPHKSVSEQLAEQAKIHIQEVKSRECNKLKGTLSLPLPSSLPPEKVPVKKALQRTKSLVVPALVLPSDNDLIDAKPNKSQNANDSNVHNTTKGDFDVMSGLTLSTWSSPFYEDGGNHLSVAKRLSDPDSRKGMPNEGGGGGNLHRKLQRQLTLNPNYDPRLVHMRSFIQQQQQHRPPPSSRTEMDTEQKTAQAKERLVRHSSAGNVRTKWNAPPDSNLHQNVTRIASAPDSYHQWHLPGSHHKHPSNATSDPQLHHFGAPSYVWGSSAPPPPVQNQSPSTWHPPAAVGLMATHEDQRHHLYYHLASVFPVEQVRAAMEVHPEETNPQAICAAILAMFRPSE